MPPEVWSGAAPAFSAASADSIAILIAVSSLLCCSYVKIGPGRAMSFCCCVSRLVCCSICRYPRLVLSSCSILIGSNVCSIGEELSLDRKLGKVDSANMVVDAVGLVSEACSGSIGEAR